MKITAADVLASGAETFNRNNPAYGNNWEKVGIVMATMYPDGLMLKTADDHARYHIFSWIVGKLTRYGHQFSKGGHRDSIHDISVYAAMLEALDLDVADRASLEAVLRDGSVAVGTAEPAGRSDPAPEALPTAEPQKIDPQSVIPPLGDLRSGSAAAMTEGIPANTYAPEGGGGSPMRRIPTVGEKG